MPDDPADFEVDPADEVAEGDEIDIDADDNIDELGALPAAKREELLHDAELIKHVITKVSVPFALHLGIEVDTSNIDSLALLCNHQLVN